MLENDRYNRALITNAKEREERDRNFSSFLEQEFIIQDCLRRLGVCKKTPIEKLPKVDMPVVNDHLLRKTPLLIVELIGMINSGKTSALNIIEGKFPSSEIAIFDDAARKIEKNSGREIKLQNPAMFQIISECDVERCYEELDKNKVFIPPEILMAWERGLWDKTVIVGHNYCRGLLHVDCLTGVKRVDRYPSLSQLPTCVINCLIRPEISLAREVNSDNPMLLDRGILFEQYLKLHDEAISGQLPIPIYTALDLETDLEIAMEKILKTIKFIRNEFYIAHHLNGRQLRLL